jgi:flagellar hook protein FlgE
MGLASALTTALTGLTAAETQIDVVGNNLANSQTVGFKASQAVFVTQFLQTQTLGSAPSDRDGGTNPRQTGLGVRVGEITPDFTQGTIEVSSNPSDLAIQGDGFFVVRGSQGETLYSRNGLLKTNSNNELVTTTGNLVLGFGVDSSFQIDPSSGLVPLTIPLGDKAVAKATTEVTLEGTLTPTGGVADLAQVIQSAILGDGSIPRPDVSGSTATPSGAGNLTGNYSYLVTFYDSNANTESRPSLRLGPATVVNGQLDLASLPNIPAGTTYDQVRIYRNIASDTNSYYLVDTVNAPGGVPANYTDNKTDAAISDLTVPGNQLVDMEGPRIGFSTLLTDVVRRDGLNYAQVFQEGTLSFDARKGGRQLATKIFEITSTSTVEDLLLFMEAAMGIQTQADDPNNPFPGSRNVIPGESGTLSPGAEVRNGQLRIVGNNGVDNAIEIGLSNLRLTTASNQKLPVNLGFGTIQQAAGQSTVTDFIAYDSLGMPINVRITAVLQSVDGNATTYRWFADSPQNDGPGSPDVAIAVGTGLISFDGEGNFISATNNLVSIDRRDVPSDKPLEFALNFGTVSGLAASKASLSATRQDGSPEGKLTSYIIGEDGVIRGVFSNGVTRELGQLQLARFANPAGLTQVGQSMYAEGVNSGLPVIGSPNEKGIGKIIAGARELSNTDIGRNMIDLVLATTMYRGNSRVISTAQQLLDELLNLRR